MKKIGFILFFINLGLFTSAQIVTDSLQAMYSFNNGTAEDDIGPWDGTPVNATLIPDRFGNPDHAYWLNGTPNSYIKLGTTSVLKPAECSISMWVRIDSLITAGSGYYHNILLVTKCQAGNNFYEAYALYYNMSTHKIIAVTTTAPSNQQVVYSLNQNSLHTWYHLVMTFDYSKIKFYIDGVYQGQLLKNYTTVYLPSDSVMIGNSCNTQNSRYYRGAVDDLRFYNRVISPLEIDSLFNEPDPNISIQPVAGFQNEETKICPNTCISFTNFSQNATSYEWFFPGAIPDYSALQTPLNICYAASGNYDVTLVVHNGLLTDTLTIANDIQVYPAVFPEIILSNDTLYCTGTSGSSYYQWSLNGVVISGATNNFWVESMPGNYSVGVVNNSDCEGSDTLEVINTGIKNILTNEEWFINPNPTTDIFHVTYNGKRKINSLTFYNVLGEKIWWGEKSEANTWEINANQFSAGIYFLTIRFSDEMKTIRVYKCD